MAEDLILGPCLVFYGDPTQASGAGMTWLGQTRGDVVVSPGVRSVSVQTDQLGGASLHSNTFSLGPNPTARVPLIDNDVDKYLAIIPDGEKVTGTNTVLNFGSGVVAYAPDTLCLLPFFERGDGIAAAHAVWFPSALVEEIGDINYKALDGGGSAESAHVAVFRSLYREQDQDTPPNTIPEKGRLLMMGDPNENVGAGQWSLPSTAGPFSVG